MSLNFSIHIIIFASILFLKRKIIISSLQLSFFAPSDISAYIRICIYWITYSNYHNIFNINTYYIWWWMYSSIVIGKLRLKKDFIFSWYLYIYIYINSHFFKVLHWQGIFDRIILYHPCCLQIEIMIPLSILVIGFPDMVYLGSPQDTTPRFDSTTHDCWK